MEIDVSYVQKVGSLLTFCTFSIGIVDKCGEVLVFQLSYTHLLWIMSFLHFIEKVIFQGVIDKKKSNC